MLAELSTATRSRPRWSGLRSRGSQGLLGSQFLGMHPPVPASQIALDLNYDMLLPVGVPRSVSLGGAERIDFWPTIQTVAKAFDLTEAEKNFLLGAEVGTGIFFAGKRHVAIQIVPSYFEDQIITTNPEQLLEEKDQDKLSS